MRIHSLALAAAGALTLAATAIPAAASDLTITAVAVKGSLVTISNPGGPPGGNPLYAAVLQLSGVQNIAPTGSVDFDVFCVDLLSTITTGGGQNLHYNFGTHLDLVPPISGAVNVDVRKLAGLYFANPGSFNNTQRAALQVAIWSVIYPQLTLSGPSAAFNNQVATYLAGLPGYSTDWGARYLISDNNPKRQDFITGGVVPEPATWAMLIVGFGLVGVGLRRRQTARLAAVSA